jgi:hypothetical protein
VGAALLNQRIDFPRQGANQISFCGMASLLVSRYAAGVMSVAQRYQEISVNPKDLRAATRETTTAHPCGNQARGAWSGERQEEGLMWLAIEYMSSA